MARLRLASWQPSPARETARPLNVRGIAPLRAVKTDPAENARSPKMLIVAVAAHLAVFWILLTSNFTPPEVPTEQSAPMMVSLIAEPPPAPAVEEVKPAPKPEPVKVPAKKPVVHQVQKPKPEPKPEPVPVPKAEAAPQPEAQQAPPPPVTAQVAPPAAEPAPAPQVAQPQPAPEPEPVVEPPRFGVAYLKNPPPEYPAVSRRMGEEGRVVLRVLVSADGKPETVDIENGSGSRRLDNAAKDAVKKWQFIPAKRNNQPISATVLVPLKFALNG